MACDVRLPTLEWPGTWEQVKFTSRDQMWVCPYELRETNGLQAYWQHSHIFKQKFNLAIVELCLKTAPLLRFQWCGTSKLKFQLAVSFASVNLLTDFPEKIGFLQRLLTVISVCCTIQKAKLLPPPPPRICVTTIKDNFAIISSLTFMTKFDQNWRAN